MISNQEQISIFKPNTFLMAGKTNIGKQLFQSQTSWKFYLTIVGLIIILLTLLFVNFLAQRLKEGEKARAEISEQAFTSVSESLKLNPNKDMSLELEVIEKTKDIPMIITNMNDEVIMGRNFNGNKNNNKEFLNRQLNRIQRQNIQPIIFEDSDQKIYYKYSKYYTLLVYFPLFQFILLLAFIGLGYVGFSTARRAEQNRVWVGMAKETAHQLGTPITAIMAWVEHLRDMMRKDDHEKHEVLDELMNDVSRLNLIADRFSKIGSAPELKKINIYEELEKCRNYMQKRAPRKVRFKFPDNQSNGIFVNINPPLFDWVVENLLRNALDAMEGKGEISAEVNHDEDFVTINISDTGKGIPSNKFKAVFQPGYTTKSRGWGLGLSLAKRIIELYHRGKIFVKNSQVNEGTTFTIKLPKVV